MSITADEMAQKLTRVARRGVRSNIEEKKVVRLDPIVIMALADTDEIKMVRLSVRKGSNFKNALGSCLRHYNAYVYTFVKEGDGTEFPGALLMANGNFDTLPSEDKYQVITLQTGIKGTPSLLMSRAKVESNQGQRTLTEWTDVRLEEDSSFFPTDW